MIIQWLNELDAEVFTLLHYRLAMPRFDSLIVLIRNAGTWIPLYLAVLFWVIRYHRSFAIQFLVLSVVTVAITDYSSASIIKPMVARARPCFNPELSDVLRNLVGCGGFNSFPSSHAANHTGLATFWFLAIQYLNGRKWWILFFWALLIGYAQVYVGKHYPLDIAAGALLGLLVGITTAKIFNRWCGPTKPIYRPVVM